MKRLLALLLLSSTAFATTSVTGHIQNLGTSGISNGAFVRFWLRGCGGNQPTVTGSGIIAPSQGGVYYFDITAGASGAVSGTIYSTRDATGLLGGDISCGGSTTAVWYGMQIFQAGKGGPEVPIHAKNSATLDITSVTPITTNPVVTAPTGDSTYARLDGGNQPFTGSITPSGTGVLNLGSSTNRWNAFITTLNVSGGGTLAGTFSGGTFTSTTLTSPTITSPTISSGATLSGTFAGGTFTGTTLTTPTINGGTLSGTFTGGTFSSPTVNVISFPEQAAPSGASLVSVCYADNSLHRLLCSYNNNTFYQLPQVKSRGTSTLTSSPISGGACAGVVTSSAANAVTSDVIIWDYSSAPAAATDALLILSAYPTSTNVNFRLCNPTSGSITPSGLVINWAVITNP